MVKAQDLNAIVKEMLHLLQVSISKKADLRVELQEGLPAIMAEAAQVQQVVMNLVTNASDSLATGPGAIRVATSLERLDAATIARQFQNQELKPGEYIVLEVADTGCGIAEEVMGRIFDPFFTTKSTGRGLGLSALLGILRGHKAGIRIHSEVNKGSVFEVYFPVSGEALPASHALPLDRAGSLTGTVLLVDDEEMILESTGMALEAIGLTVVTARDGVQGLERFMEMGPKLSLVLMDLSMPRMDGATAFLAMHAAHPEVPVLLSSGYDPQEPGDALLGKGLAGFIQKPYRIKELAAAVVEAMAKKPAP
jgi:CheY-like chemotaxis protein